MMEFPELKRRQNIRVSEQEADGQKIYLISDEAAEAYYKFHELEFEIFWNLDGQTPLAALKEKIEKRFAGIDIPLEELQAFTEDLKQKGLLEGFEHERPKTGRRQDLFYRCFKVMDPDALLEKLVRPLSFAFQEPFVLTGLLLIAWSLFFIYFHRELWFSQTKSLLNIGGFVLFYAAFAVIGFVHEMGHALTCKYYGGRVKEIGVIFIYFGPGFYANVSDSYLFREKKPKILVGAAGLFFQFLFSAFLVMLWYFTIPGALLSNILIAMIGVSGFSAFFNLTPFIKLDGYYMLSDWLGVVNLRAHSFHYLKLLFEKWLFNLPKINQEIAGISPRLRKIYFWYSIGGIPFAAFMLYLSFRFYRFVASLIAPRFIPFIRNSQSLSLQGFGLLLLAGGIAWWAWNWYQKNGPEIKRLRENVKDTPELERLFQSKKRKILSAVAALFLLSLVFWTRWGLKGPCEVKPEIKRALAPLEQGIIVHVSKQSGESIKAGEVFANLDDFETRRELAVLQIDKRLKEEQLLLLKANYGASLTAAQGDFNSSQLALQAHQLLSPHRIQESKNAMEAAKAHLEKTQTNLRIAEKEWERYQVLAKEQVISPKEAEEKQSAYESAKEEYTGAQKEYAAASQTYLETLNQGLITDPQKLHQNLVISKKNLTYTQDKAVEIQTAQSEIALVDAQIKTDQEKLQRLVIRSPINGIIMTPHVKELEGKMVDKGQPVAWVYEPGPMIFEIHTDELDVSEVPTETSAHNDVKVKLLALPGASFRGKVRKIVPESLSNSRSKDYLVDVAVSDPEGKLLPGMQGTGKIYGKWHPLLWQIIRRPVKYVFWKLWSLF